MTFQRMFEEKMIDYGLDTIAHLPNPADPTKMMSVITNHGWYNLKEGVQKANHVAQTYFDDYDESNQRDATKLLFN